MNDQLITNDGGQPFYASDFSFMQNALRTSISLLTRTLGLNYILWGVLNQDHTSIIEGACVIDGSIYQVPALGEIKGQMLCFREVEYEERTFENGSVHNVKKRIEAYLSSDTSGTVASVDPTILHTTVEEIKHSMFIYREGKGTGKSSGFTIPIDPVPLSTGDIVISTIFLSFEGEIDPRRCTSMGRVFGSGTTLFWQTGDSSFDYSFDGKTIRTVYSRTHLPGVVPIGPINVQLLIIKAALL